MVPRERVATERKRRRPTRSGVVLTADMIVDRALGLIDEHGGEALTVRRLGTALGADPSAVYRYFRNTDELFLAVADRLIGEALEGFSAQGPWPERLRELGLRVYRSALRHPKIAALSTSRVTRRPHEYHAVDTGIGLLLRAGFDEAAAVRHYHAFIDTVLGHAALDAAVLRLPAAAQEGDAQAWREAYAQVPANTYPHLHAVRAELPAMADSAFESSLDLLLEALTARAASLPDEAGQDRGEGPPGSAGPDGDTGPAA
ncbi:TetR/AcrR family transcriptional regulator [Streptomyces sp. 8N114]|uniref:TetR/AcrR family transcriptional regulator n=1 Tax=Streptomyces sp. 8N114 TaxID=3457419 RepID=UPI003FD1E0F7